MGESRRGANRPNPLVGNFRCHTGTNGTSCNPERHLELEPLVATRLTHLEPKMAAEKRFHIKRRADVLLLRSAPPQVFCSSRRVKKE